MKRYGNIVRVKPEKKSLYIELHSNPLPEVGEVIRECNIRNFTIFNIDDLLFNSFEYIGDDYESDMKRMAESSIMQEWWAKCMPCMEPYGDLADGEIWTEMKEIAHRD